MHLLPQSMVSVRMGKVDPRIGTALAYIIQGNSAKSQMNSLFLSDLRRPMSETRCARDGAVSKEGGQPKEKVTRRKHTTRAFPKTGAPVRISLMSQP
jgi:hypothetical protein